MSAALVSLIGPPAVGKTTLAEGLAAALDAELIREDYAGNPFLASSYAGRAETHLPAQLHFLLSRVEQLATWSWPVEGVRVADYGFCQDAVYARRQLTPEQYAQAYLPVARRMAVLVRPPDVLVALDAPTDALLDRIARRGRDFERAMTPAFLSGLRQAYREQIQRARCATLTVDADARDVRDPDVVEAVTRDIGRALCT